MKPSHIMLAMIQSQLIILAEYTVLVLFPATKTVTVPVAVISIILFWVYKAIRWWKNDEPYELPRLR